MSILHDKRLQLTGIYVVLGMLAYAYSTMPGWGIGAAPTAQSPSEAEWVAGYAVLVAGLAVFTFIKLPSHMKGQQQLISLIRFPKQLFWLYGTGAMALSLLELLSTPGIRPWEFGEQLAAALCVIGSVALIHFSAARWVLRPGIRGLRIYRLDDFRFRSATGVMIAHFAFGLLLAVYSMFSYSAASREEGGSPQPIVLIAIGLTVCAVTLACVYYTAFYLFRDLAGATSQLRESIYRKRSELHSRIPVASPYESGEVIEAFNALQEQSAKHYARLNRDMELAVHVQDGLFQHQLQSWREWRIEACREPAEEVSGNFYVVRPISDNRLLLAAGSVTGGDLSSALIMSAIVMMLRSLSGKLSNPADMFMELNHSLTDLLPDHRYVHLALVVLDADQEMMKYATAGNMRIRAEAPERIVCTEPDSAPLGSQDQQLYGYRQMLVSKKGFFISLYDEERRFLHLYRQGGDPLGE